MSDAEEREVLRLELAREAARLEDRRRARDAAKDALAKAQERMPRCPNCGVDAETPEVKGLRRDRERRQQEYSRSLNADGRLRFEFTPPELVQAEAAAAERVRVLHAEIANATERHDTAQKDLGIVRERRPGEVQAATSLRDALEEQLASVQNAVDEAHARWKAAAAALDEAHGRARSPLAPRKTEAQEPDGEAA